MEDLADASLLQDSGSLAPSTLERATLTRPRRLSYARSAPVSTDPNIDEDRAKYKKGSSNPGESAAFWVLIGIMVLLAAGNLSVTFFAMGVLRLGTGMESIEFHSQTKSTKFFGKTDLGNIQKKDGIIYSYSDVPFSIMGIDSKVILSLRQLKKPARIEIGPEGTEFRNMQEFKVIDPVSGKKIFSTKYPNFNMPNGVNNLNVKRSQTSRIVSPTFADLDIRSDTTIRLKGNEGLEMESKKLSWTADQDIYLKTLNGSIILDGGTGIFVEVNTLPLVGAVNLTKDRGQYKLCMCLPKRQLFRVPVPADNDERPSNNQINCASFTNPCMERTSYH